MSREDGAVQQVIARLRGDEFTGKLREWSDEISTWARCFYDQSPDLFPGNEWVQGMKGDWHESLLGASCVAEGPSLGSWSYWGSFESLCATLDVPRIVTASELRKAYDVYFSIKCQGVTGDEFDETWGHYLDYIENRLLACRQSEPFRLCTLTGLPDGGQDDRAQIVSAFEAGIDAGKRELLGEPSVRTAPSGPTEGADGETDAQRDERVSDVVLWSANGVSLRGHRLRSSTSRDWFRAPDSDDRRSARLYVRVEGRASPKAMNELLCWLRPLVLTLVGPAGVAFGDLPALLPFLRFGVSAALAAGGKKDTMDRRLGNGIRLLVEADQQRSDGIGLAIAMTALDAMLGRQEEGRSLTDVLAENVTVLLEPELERRPDAIRYVKQLYNTRSKVLHGERLDCEGEARKQARQLAMEVLKALWQRRTFVGGLGEKPLTPDDLLRDLRDGRFRKGQPTGVMESPARTLWAKSGQ